MNIDLNKVVDVTFAGIDKKDAPDFSDAYILDASLEMNKEEYLACDKDLYPSEYNGKYYRNLTEDELDWLQNENRQWFYEKLTDWIY